MCDFLTALLIVGAFIAGVLLGRKVHRLEMQSLKKQRDYYTEKADSVQKQMEQY